MPDATSTPAEPELGGGADGGLELLAGDQMELVGPNGTAAPLVLVIRRLLLGRPRLDTAAVIARLLDRLPDEDEHGVVEQCIASMRAYRDEGGVESSDGYARWLHRQVRPHPHPPLARIRKVLGGPERSWVMCKAVAFADGAVDPTVRRRITAPFATREGCLHAGRLWLDERAVAPAVGKPDLRDFLAYCRRLAVRDDRPVARAPLSHVSLRVHFGGWFGFLHALGALADGQVFAADDIAAGELSEADRAVRVNLVLAARQWAAQTNTRLRLADFEAWLRERNASSSAHTIRRLFGSFRGLVDCAGLNARHHDPTAAIEPPDWGHAYRPTHRRFTDEQILAVIDDAARTFDGDLPPSRYGTYVNARREQAQREGKVVRLPSRWLIEQRFGSIYRALHILGWITEDEWLLRSRMPYGFPRAERALIAAMLDYTPTLTASQYRLFAVAQRERHGWTVPSSYAVLCHNLGIDPPDMDAAKALVMKRNPDIQWPTELKAGLRRPYQRDRRATA